MINIPLLGGFLLDLFDEFDALFFGLKASVKRDKGKFFAKSDTCKRLVPHVGLKFAPHSFGDVIFD